MQIPSFHSNLVGVVTMRTNCSDVQLMYLWQRHIYFVYNIKVQNNSLWIELEILSYYEFLQQYAMCLVWFEWLTLMLQETKCYWKCFSSRSLQYIRS